MPEIPDKPDAAQDARTGQDIDSSPAGQDRDPSDKAGESAVKTEDDPASGAGYGNNAGQQ